MGVPYWHEPLSESTAWQNQPTNKIMSDKTEADAVADIARAGMQPIINPTVTGAVPPLVFWPKNQTTESLEKYLANPIRKRATVNLTDFQSFISYVKDFEEAGTRLFCQLTQTGGRFVAIIDYHVANDVASKLAQWGDHVVTLDMQHSPEWQVWTGKNGKEMDQLTMANFLEENRLDIKTPDAATIIEIAQTFEATQGVQFKSALRLPSGDRSLGYEVQTAAKAGEKGKFEIPEKIGVQMPIFLNGPEYAMEAFFRYNIGNGTLKLRYELIRPHKFVELALAETRNAIAEQTGLPVLSGACKVNAC